MTFPVYWLDSVYFLETYICVPSAPHVPDAPHGVVHRFVEQLDDMEPIKIAAAGKESATLQ
jgi:hypothetical protein